MIARKCTRGEYNLTLMRNDKLSKSRYPITTLDRGAEN